jgi:hypothetical protein
VQLQQNSIQRCAEERFAARPRFFALLRCLGLCLLQIGRRA